MNIPKTSVADSKTTPKRENVISTLGTSSVGCGRIGFDRAKRGRRVAKAKLKVAQAALILLTIFTTAYP
jgi:hypothetical protein